MRGRGVGSDVGHIDWPDLIRFKRAMIERVPKMREEAFSKSGIAAVLRWTPELRQPVKPLFAVR
jgi:hypothetical protein